MLKLKWVRANAELAMKAVVQAKTELKLGLKAELEARALLKTNATLALRVAVELNTARIEDGARIEGAVQKAVADVEAE
jgi:hypothetical protein